MRVIIGKKVHQMAYFDGFFVDTACGKRVWGKSGNDYTLVSPIYAKGDYNHPIWKQEINCSDCLKGDLRKELEKRGTADLSNGIVNQVTQALDEQPGKVKYLIFGELREQEILSIEEACANSNSMNRRKSRWSCQ